MLSFAARADAQTQTTEAPALRFENGIVAVVEDQVITAEDVRSRVVELIGNRVCARPILSNGRPAESMDEVVEDAIQTLIDRALVVRLFEGEARRKLADRAIDSAIAEFVKKEFADDDLRFAAFLRSTGRTRADHRREVERDLIFRFGRDRMRSIESVISLEMSEKFYRDNADRFYREDAVRLRLIQFDLDDLTDDELQAKADEAIRRLGAGESFESVARQLSEDKRRDSGGDWGWQTRADLKKEFCDILFAMEKGDYTAPIIVPEGALILYVQDRRLAGVLSFAEVRDEIENLLREEKATVAENQWLKKLRENAYVKYY